MTRGYGSCQEQEMEIGERGEMEKIGCWVVIRVSVYPSEHGVLWRKGSC